MLRTLEADCLFDGICSRRIVVFQVVGAHICGAFALNLIFAVSRGRTIVGGKLFPQLGGKLRQQIGHRDINGALLQLALPDHVYAPTHLLELTHVLSVALHVSGELRFPILDVLLRSARLAMRAAMPKASAHFQSDAFARPRDVGMPRHLPLQSIARQSCFSQALAHQQFGLRVRPFIALHAFVHRVVRRGWGGDAHGHDFDAAFACRPGFRVSRHKPALDVAR